MNPNPDYIYLTEKEEMWAEMLMEAFQNNEISFASVPVYGAGLAMRAGMRERLKIYVAPEDKSRAEELLGELFPQDGE